MTNGCVTPVILLDCFGNIASDGMRNYTNVQTKKSITI